MKQEPDQHVQELIEKERERQQEGLEMIPSENLASPAVMEATGSVLTNKYSEGYPGKRYYGGNEVIDEIENLTIQRAKELFGADHVNVQPYSGSPANMAVYHALMEPGDTFLAMRLSHGGHLTHGHDVNFSGQLYDPVHYGVREEDERIDFDQVRSLAEEHDPVLIEAGFTAYPRAVEWERFREICDATDALLFADMSHIGGLVAGDAHPSPVPYADVITTTTHKTLRGPRGAIIMCKEEYAEAIDKAVFPGLQGGPHDHTTAAKAQCFHEALQPEFTEYAQQVVKNAEVLADELRDNFDLISDGTDTHMVLMDVSKHLSGKEAEQRLEEAGIYVNKNTVPYDPNPPFDPSGIRFGTPAITTRDMEEAEMRKIAKFFERVLLDTDVEAVRDEVEQLCQQFPIYEE